MVDTARDIVVAGSSFPDVAGTGSARTVQGVTTTHAVQIYRSTSLAERLEGLLRGLEAETTPTAFECVEARSVHADLSKSTAETRSPAMEVST